MFRRFSIVSMMVALAYLGSVSARAQHDGHDHSGHDHSHDHAGHDHAEFNMDAWMKMMSPGKNHEVLAGMVGTWDYTTKFWMDPAAPPTESKGRAKAVAKMGGRYIASHHEGKMEFPGPDGKMTEWEFEGLAITGYDNIQQKFVSTWIDNMGTGIMMAEGKYDAATKTFTYTAEMPDPTGSKVKIREVIRIINDDKHVFEWYETRQGTEVKTMEITYVRRK